MKITMASEYWQKLAIDSGIVWTLHLRQTGENDRSKEYTMYMIV